MENTERETIHKVEPFGTGAAICGYDNEGEPFGASVSGLGVDCAKCVCLMTYGPHYCVGAARRAAR
jgi:hypothetical protein